MTDPVVIRRTLTVHFARSVTFPDQIPQTMEVIVVPLADPSSAAAVATFVSPSATQTVLLNAADNIVTFDLVPTDLPGLTERVLYRIMWRAGVTGKTSKTDFAMPDADIDFDDLADLGNIIAGETYLQQADLGVPGRVARLNNAGEVVDAFGTPVATQNVIQTIQGDISVERVARQAGDAAVRNDLTAAIETQFNQAITTAETNLSAAETSLLNQIAAEAAVRAANDTTEASTRSAAVASLTTTLNLKADLVSGKIPPAQIPDSVKIQGVSVADQTAMLALTTSQVQQFDYAIRPTGLWLFKGTDPSNLAHWAKINRVTSVNTLEGDVVLTAADVGAIPTGGSIAQSQVTGLVSALAGKAATTVTDGLNTRLTSIEGDTTYVHTSGGFINHDLNDTRMAYVDVTGEFVTTKDGTILSGAGGAVASVNTKTGDVVLNAADVGAIAIGASIAESQVTGLVSDLAAKVDTSDSRLTNARTPTAHAPSHAVAGSDPITIATSQVTGLATTLTNHGNRLTSLETRVTTLEGGPGGGGANIGTTVFYADVAETEDFSTVVLHSPFGVDIDGATTGTPGTPYYDPAGAVETDVRYPYITPNGHLQLREWKESNPADPATATQAALDTTNATVATKANQSSLDTTNTTVATKASTAALNALNDIVATKAAQTSLDNTNATVMNKANQVDLDATNVTVAAKANQSSLNTTNTNVTALQTGKADLDGGGHVPLAQLPAVPQSQVTGLVSALGGKADLSGGFLVLAQVPAGIPTSKVSGLDAAMALKADLDSNGKVPTNQMPALALVSVTVVANRAAMLAQANTTVQPGDVTVITATSDQGSYILQDPDPSVFGNWVLLQTPLAPVLTVNGQVGTVVLSASDVGAIAANAALPISQITGLQSTLDSKATVTALTDGLATKTSTTDVRAILSASVEAKQKINYVSTTAVPSLSGQQSADGVLMPLGSSVLLTAQSSSVLNGIWCVDEETEILTRSGYKRHTAVVEEDETLTFNLKTGMAEWQPVQSMHRFAVENETMLSMERADHSSLTTMNHRWPVQRTRFIPEELKGQRARDDQGRWIPDKGESGPWYTIRQSHQLNNSDQLIRSASVMNLPDQAKYTDALVELVGWFITEGHIRRNNTNTAAFTSVRISQSHRMNPDKVERIRAALTRLFGPAVEKMTRGRRTAGWGPQWRENSARGDMTVFSLNAVAGEVLCGLAPDKVATMEFVNSLTESQLRLFIDTCVAADGHTNKITGMRTFMQKSLERLEPVQVACTLAGIATTLGWSRSGHGGGVHVLTLCERRRFIQPHLQSSQQIAYSGTVWCPKTENGTWFARRRGQTYFTGNTVNSGAWTRVADMVSGSYLVKGTIVVVGAGATNANTIWQVTSASGVVDTNLNNWVKIANVAPPYAPIQGNGIAITGTAPTQTITAVAAPGGGASVSPSGIGVDVGVVARKALGTVPAGSATVTLTHNLNTTSPMVQIIEASSGTSILLGWAVTGANTVSVEFSSAPSTGQWRYVIVG